jgi:hypothetical protein
MNWKEEVVEETGQKETKEEFFFNIFSEYKIKPIYFCVRGLSIFTSSCTEW